MTTDKRIQYFASAGEYVDHVRTCTTQPDWEYQSWLKDNEQWAGGSYSQALEYASNGWPEGLKKLTGQMDILKTHGRGKSRLNDVAGDYPIVARAVAGLPDSMSRRVMSDSSRKPIIDIYICPVMTSQGDADKFIILGAAMADFIDACEGVGYSVNLMVSMVAQRNGYAGGSCFPLKTGGQSLDLEKIVYFIGHPTFLRRLGFKDFANKMKQSELGQNMGRACEMGIHAEIAEKNSIMLLPDAHIVNNIRNVIDARRWVEAEVKRQRPELIDSLAGAA